MAERTDYEYGPITPVPEDQQEYFFNPELRGQLERGEAFQGVPLSVSQDRRMAENPLGTIATGIGSLLDRDRREVLMPASQEFGPTRQEFNPASNQFENRTTETIRPGVYGTPETMPGLSGTPIYQGLDAASSLISDTAARRRGLEDSAEARSQAAEMIPQIPQMLVDQADVSMEAGLRGERVVNEQNMSGTPFEMISAPIGALGAGRVAMDIPEGRSFGIFGSGKGASGQQAEDTVSMLEESGLDPAEGWERQSGANTYKAYRSSLDNKVRYEIPTANVSFKQAFRETEDPDVELGKVLDPETRNEQRLLSMQGLRIRKINDKDYLTVPGFFQLDDKVLNKYGFTTSDYKVREKGLLKFPSPVLEQIVDFPELFKEYPQLRSIQIKPTPPLALFVQGAYNPDEKTIMLAPQQNTVKGRKEMMSTLLHEVQHAVQDIEGLYGGANTKMFEPVGFGEKQTNNRKALEKLQKNIEDDLDSLVVTVDDPALEKPKTGIFTKMFGLSDQNFSSKTQTAFEGAAETEIKSLKRATQSYLKTRAEEEEQLSLGELTKAEQARRDLDDAIAQQQAQMRKINQQYAEMDAPSRYSNEEIDAIDAEYRGQAFRYSGSDREMIYLNDKLQKAGVKNPAKVAEKIESAFDDQIKKLRPILKEKNDIKEIQTRMFDMYSGNPGEVEARNVQRRFEGIEEGEYVRAPSGERQPFPETLTSEELQRTFPEDTQQMVLPEGGLVYSLSEGRKNQPSLSIDNSGINNDLDKKRAKLQQQQSIYANRNGQLLGDGSPSKPLTATTRKKLEEERRVAGRKAMELSHEIDIEEAEPNLPDNIITRDSSGSILPSTDYHQANQLAFHGTRGADSRIMEEGGVHMKTDEPAFFMVDSPAASMTYGAGGIGDLGTVVPMRIDTRGFAEIDYRGRSYGELDEGGTVGVEFPQETTFLGQKGTAFEVEIDFDDIVTVRVDGSAAKTVPVDLIEQYHPEGRGVVNEETFLNAVKDAGAPGARLNEINDLHPTGAMVLRGSTQLKLPETQEILTVFDKSRQRLAKGNPASRDDDLMTGIVRNPLSGFAQGGAVQRFNQGGMVSPMNKPRVTQGLTNLLNKYSTGPLAGAGNVSRGTPVQPFNQGGAAQTYEEALNDPNRMNLAKRLGPEAWASSGIGNTPSQPLVNSLEYRNYGSNKNVPQGDFNPIVTRTFTPEELSQRAADRGYGSVENLSKAEKAGLQLDQSPYFNSYETKSQMQNSLQGDQRYTNYDPGDYARGSGPKIMIDPVSSIPVTSLDYNVPGSGTSTGTISTGPVSTTSPYEDAPVAQTDNFEDNPVTSVPVVTPASTAPATADPLTSDLAVSITPATTTPGTTTQLPPSVYNSPAPSGEAVYTPPAATVVDTPETLFTPPEVFDVPEAKEYQYLQDLRPDFDISDVIKTQTGGYAPTQGMVINPTEYQYSPDQVMSDNVYVPQIYKPMSQLTLSDIDATEGTTSEDSTAETDTEDTASTADTTQGTSFASLDSLSSNQQAYNPEQDYADRYGYTLAELRQINAERLRMGLPRLQDLQTDIGDINFSGGM